VLVTGSLGVLLTQKLAGDAARAIAAQGTQTANSSSTGTAAANTSATATAAAHASATAMAQAVHYPYRAAALGPGCDKGNGPWVMLDGVPKSVLKCFSDHTFCRGTFVAFGWRASGNAPLPQNYRVSFELRNLSPQVPTNSLNVDIDQFFALGYAGSGIAYVDTNYYVNPSQTHTLSFTVKGTVVTATADNHTFRSFTDTSGALSRASEIEFLFDYDSHTTLTVDLSNFVITALA